jgi:DNA-binding response OmpR family regulator
MTTNEMPTIVLAEDDKFISKAYQDAFRRDNFNVIPAHDGVEALEMIRTHLPNIILLDVIMPGKNGFEVLEEIKKDPKISDIPVIILSNLGQDRDIEKGKELGAVDYVIKSNFTISEIVKKIEENIK